MLVGQGMDGVPYSLSMHREGNDKPRTQCATNNQHAWGLVEGRYFDAERLSDLLSGQKREDVAPSRIGDEYA